MLTPGVRDRGRRGALRPPPADAAAVRPHRARGPRAHHGRSRRYSPRNIEQLREVAQLSSEGVSLPAIARLLDLEDENRMLRDRIAVLEGALRTERENRPGVRVFAAGSAGVVPMPTGRRIRRSTEVVLWDPRGSA